MATPQAMQQKASPRNRLAGLNGTSTSHATARPNAAADECPISSTIPMPAKRTGRSYPWDKLKVGDSFFAAGKTTNSICAARSAAAARLGHTYATRTWTEAGVQGVRVWRLA